MLVLGQNFEMVLEQHEMTFDRLTFQKMFHLGDVDQNK